jgi:hypothetical protein
MFAVLGLLEECCHLCSAFMFFSENMYVYKPIANQNW